MSDADTSLRGKVAFVAGGYGGVGEACARALARQGATTVIAGRNAGKAEAVARALEGQVAASSVAFDARDVASIRDAVGEVASRHGRIDFLVNCVGTQQIEPMIDVTEEAFDRIKPHANNLFSRLSDGEDFAATAKRIADLAGVTPGQVALFVHAVMQSQEEQPAAI